MLLEADFRVDVTMTGQVLMRRREGWFSKHKGRSFKA